MLRWSYIKVTDLLTAFLRHYVTNLADMAYTFIEYRAA